MKKFLFTLATAMLAGGMFAGEFVSGGTEYFYMDDANVTENLGGTVQLNVKAHFEASVSAWQVDFGMYNENGEFISNVLPGGLTVKTSAKGSDLTLTYTDDAGDEGTTSPSLQKGQDNTRFIVAQMEGNYWDPDGDGEFELQGVAKWGPGEYEQMWKMTFNIPADFTGGEIAIQTRPTSGFDNNPEVTTTAGEKAWYKFNLTVDGAPMEQTEKPVITSEETEEGVVVTATGNGHICLYWDDVLQAEGEGVATWTIPYGDDPEGEEYGVSATAQEEGKEVSEYALATIFVPGKPSSEQTQTPSGSYQVVHGKLEVIVTITPYEGDVFYRIIHTAPDGTITESDWMPYVDAFSLYEDGRYRVEFYAVAEGKLPSEIGVLVFTISPMAGIEEMTTDKSVASVRYFNMAGQEMQLPNGMTIIVTTYTDGTSSAIKVMK